MSEERMRILSLLAEGKISAAEADTLLDAMGTPAESAATVTPITSADTKGSKAAPTFMYVKVTGNDSVDVKVPLGLLRAGLKLTSLIPPQAMDQINDSMGEHGMSFDLNNLKPEDIEEIIVSLADMEVNVESHDGDHIRVFCA